MKEDEDHFFRNFLSKYCSNNMFDSSLSYKITGVTSVGYLQALASQDQNDILLWVVKDTQIERRKWQFLKADNPGFYIIKNEETCLLLTCQKCPLKQVYQLKLCQSFHDDSQKFFIQKNKDKTYEIWSLLCPNKKFQICKNDLGMDILQIKPRKDCPSQKFMIEEIDDE